MKTNRKEIDPDEIEQEAIASGRHWKEILKERLVLISSATKREGSLKRCFERIDAMPLENPHIRDDGSVNHDATLYGWKN